MFENYLGTKRKKKRSLSWFFPPLLSEMNITGDDEMPNLG